MAIEIEEITGREETVPRNQDRDLTDSQRIDQYLKENEQRFREEYRGQVLAVHPNKGVVDSDYSPDALKTRIASHQEAGRIKIKTLEPRDFYLPKETQ